MMTQALASRWDDTGWLQCTFLYHVVFKIKDFKEKEHYLCILAQTEFYVSEQEDAHVLQWNFNFAPDRGHTR